MRSCFGKVTESVTQQDAQSTGTFAVSLLSYLRPTNTPEGWLGSGFDRRPEDKHGTRRRPLSPKKHPPKKKARVRSCTDRDTALGRGGEETERKSSVRWRSTMDSILFPSCSFRREVSLFASRSSTPDYEYEGRRALQL